MKYHFKNLFQHAFLGFVVAALFGVNDTAMAADEGVLLSSVLGTHGTKYEDGGYTTNIRNPIDIPGINPFKTYAQNLSDFTGAVGAGKLNRYGTVVHLIYGGKFFSNVGPFLDAIKADGGAGYSQYVSDIYGLVKHRPNTIFQVGNEIQNQYVSESFHLWLKDGLPGVSNDLAVPPLYAKYWLGPMARGCKEQGCVIALGSIANVTSQAGLAFLDALLRYRFDATDGTYLSGKTVAQVVDYCAIQYTQTSAKWRAPKDLCRAYGLKTLNTEEVGAGAAERGLGMVSYLKSVGRCLDDAALYGQCTVYGWGSWIEPNSVNAGMPKLVAYVGNERLFKAADVAATGTGLEVYALRVGTTNKRLLMITGGTLTGITGATSGVVYVYSDAGIQELPLTHIHVELGKTKTAYVEVTLN